MRGASPIRRPWRLVVAQALLLWNALARGQAPTSPEPDPVQPSAVLQISGDGTCGGTTGQTCAGSTWGQCCSLHGYCGSSDSYCDKGCDARFGTCNPGQGTSVFNTPPPPSGTQREGPNPSCPLCPVCTICMSSTPTVVPSSCRVILTATRWETATTTTTVTATRAGDGGGKDVAADSPLTCPVLTITTTTTATAVVAGGEERTTTLPVSTKTVTQTQVETQTRTQMQTQTQTKTQIQTKTQVQTVTLVSTVTVEAASSPAVSILTGPTPPSPVLPGAVANCKRWYQTQEGDTCGSVADEANISKDDLRSWNTRIGNNTDATIICELGKLAQLASNLCRLRCGDLWGGYYVCVGV